MIILGVESSAVSVSAAVMKDGKLISEVFANNGLTHSVTLLPQIKNALDFAGISADEVDVFAVSAGPGSFTGLRIGAATVKGLCSEKSFCLGVSTLEAMAFDHSDFKGTVCAVMDARCMQVYNALFQNGDSKALRLCEDRAVMIEELICELSKIEGEILLIGDGTALCLETIKKTVPELLNKVKSASNTRVFQRAGGVCACANSMLLNGVSPVSANDLEISYLRLPQAERELKKKEK